MANKVYTYELKAYAKAHGLSHRYVDGEHRINFADGTEETAYYTDDALDALRTMERYAGDNSPY